MIKCINCFKELKTKEEQKTLYCRECDGDEFDGETSECCDAVIVNGRCYRCKENIK